MKTSNYNFVFPYKEEPAKKVFYNSFSNALALIDQDSYKKYQDFCQYSIPIGDDKLVNDLKYGHFLIDDAINELDVLRVKLMMNRFAGRQSFSLTIAATLDCNMKCIYCYEGETKHKTMSEKVQDELVEDVRSRIKNLKVFTVTWYGGEPLLATNVIERLTEQFIQLCDENNVIYSASIITNGYLLTPEIASNFEKWRINMCQVTLDGPREVHNARRPLKSGGPTYDAILLNISNCKNVF